MVYHTIIPCALDLLGRSTPYEQPICTLSVIARSHKMWHLVQTSHASSTWAKPIIQYQHSVSAPHMQDGMLALRALCLVRYARSCTQVCACSLSEDHLPCAPLVPSRPAAAYCYCAMHRPYLRGTLVCLAVQTIKKSLGSFT